MAQKLGIGYFKIYVFWYLPWTALVTDVILLVLEQVIKQWPPICGLIFSKLLKILSFICISRLQNTFFIRQ